MHAHIASPAQTHRASTAVPVGFRARLAVVTAFLQRLPLPLLQLLFRLAIAAVFLKGGPHQDGQLDAHGPALRG
jgi:hypothetical protein